jgi:pimeloyl-ACP methyl ester carboxylesterase
MKPGSLWQRIRRIWVTLGIAATVIFFGWSLVAYRATPEAHAARRTDARVTVSNDRDAWRFQPGEGPVASVGLLFFPGSLVDPAAYAPLARAAAESGYVAVIVELPRRGAFGGADDPGVPARAREVMREPGGPRRWVIAGHSRGAVVASALASAGVDSLAGLILIGTSHPRDVNLAGLAVPVTKIIGTRDGLASVSEVEANRHLLPATTRWVRVEGGNHSQFGWYGFQPGDRSATISADAQRAEMLAAVLATLRGSAERGEPRP